MEALIGVLIGAVIGYVAAITTLVVEHRRWRKEFKLQYLITERIRREGQCDRIKELMYKSPNEDLFSFDELSTTICQRLPLKTLNLINKAMNDMNFSQPEAKQEVIQAISKILGAYLQGLDEQIE